MRAREGDGLGKSREICDVQRLATSDGVDSRARESEVPGVGRAGEGPRNAAEDLPALGERCIDDAEYILARRMRCRGAPSFHEHERAVYASKHIIRPLAESFRE